MLTMLEILFSCTHYMCSNTVFKCANSDGQREQSSADSFLWTCSVNQQVFLKNLAWHLHVTHITII